MIYLQPILLPPLDHIEICWNVWWHVKDIANFWCAIGHDGSLCIFNLLVLLVFFIYFPAFVQVHTLFYVCIAETQYSGPCAFAMVCTHHSVASCHHHVIRKMKSGLLCKSSHFPYENMISPGANSLCILAIQTADFILTLISSLPYPTIWREKCRKHNFWKHYKALSQNCHTNLFRIMALMRPHNVQLSL